jgi:hypothetical protein
MKAVKSAVLIASLSFLLFSCKDDDAPTPGNSLSGNYTFDQSRVTGRIVVITDTGVSDSVVTNYSYTVTGTGDLEFDAKYIHQKNIAYKYLAQTEYVTYFNGEVTNKSETSSEQEVASFSKKIEYHIEGQSIYFSEPLLDNEKDLVAFPLAGSYVFLRGAAVLALGNLIEKRDTTTNPDGTPIITIKNENHIISLAQKLN